MGKSIFYRDKPVFGLDIGHNSVKILQTEPVKGVDRVLGYGSTNFDATAISDGVIVNPEEIARQTYDLINQGINGEITTRRVAVALPVSFTYTQMVTMPPMEEKDVPEAVRQEAEQSIPVPIDQLYLDHEIIRRGADGQYEILLVGTPKTIVDSHLRLLGLLDLEPTLIETTINSVTRLVAHAEPSGEPTLIIDFGSVSSDLAIYDRAIRVTGTVNWGGDTMTNAIASALNITHQQAYTIKTRYGLDPGKKQQQIAGAINPLLAQLVEEIQRMNRFYQERAGHDKQIKQIVILGGGANLPGLSAHLTNHLRLPTRLIDSWQNFEFGKLSPPHRIETTLYTTAAGLSLFNNEAFRR